ncbi:MAG: PHP domain-containing protein [Ruminococcaceae bacterium]|nr:PHP domain-containing protein [Oscillospiraceae bacterium]
MKNVLIDKNRNFYKANLHCHTTMSDGKLTREEIKEAYKAKGYSIVAFTDHEHLIDNSYLNDDSFLAITSAELAIKEFPEQSTLVNLKMKVCHLNVLSPAPDYVVTPCYSSFYDHYVNDENRDLIKFDKEFNRVHTKKGINKIIREANSKGFLVAFNHPSWSLENATDYIGLDGLWGVEIYNNSVVTMGGMGDEHAFDDLLCAGKKVYCIAADDNHNGAPFGSDQCDSFGGFTVVNCDSLDYDNVFSSLKNGFFYASTAPEINSLVYEDGKLTFECSEVRKVSLITEGRRRKALTGNITSGEFEIKENDGYFRLRFEDSEGRCAYTQAYDLCDME